MRGEWHRFGYTCVSFGEPVSLRKHVADAKIDFRLLAAEPRHAEIEKLGNRLMQAVGRVVPALPVSLVSTAMLEAGENPLSLLDIKQRVSGLIGELEAPRQLCPHSARRPRLRDFSGLAHADAAPSRSGGETEAIAPTRRN